MVKRERRVVVGVSQSLAGLAALRFALREAQNRDAQVYAVRSWVLPSHWQGPAVNAWKHDLRTEARRYIVDAFAAAVGGQLDLDVLIAAPSGRPDHVLTATANSEHDLIVLGGHSGRWRPWPSWVVRGCLSNAECPVIVVPPPALARAAGPLARRQLIRAADRLTSGADR